MQGYGVDDNFTIVPGALGALTIPIGQVSTARATETVEMDGVLSSADTIATSASAHTSQALIAGGGADATASTLLTDLRAASAAGVTLFATGDVITVSGVAKGERDLPDQQFVVGTDGTTLGDFASWLETAFGIQTGNSLPGTPGVTVESGQLVIRGNNGEPNAIDIRSADITSSNTSSAIPFEFTETGEAEGTGVYTSFTVYDSLGNPVTVNATFTLESLPDTGPVWRYYLESSENGSSGRALGTGTVTFNTEGLYTGINGDQFSLDRTGSGAATPLTFTLDLSNLNGLSTQESSVLLGEQDGYPPGTLNSFSVDSDGTIIGAFSNGLTQTLGQVPLAMFRNDAGLVAESDNLFSVGTNSGPAQITTAGLVGSGEIVGGALEMSNVDLTQEFIGLITSSTAFQAASRVITVSNDMLDQLMLALR